MRTTTLLPLILAAACGSSKPDPVTPLPAGGSAQAGAPELPQPPPPPPADPKPAAPEDPLVVEAKQFAAQMDAELRKLYVDAVASPRGPTRPTSRRARGRRREGRRRAGQGHHAPHQGGAASSSRSSPSSIRPPAASSSLLKFAGQPAPDDPKQADELAKIATEMSSIYGKGKVCKKVGAKQECKDLDALSKVLQKTRKPEEALAAWKGWHDNVGRAERDLFVKYVELANAGARGVGFTDVASMWKSGYDMPADAFEAETDRLCDQMKPLYEQLHCYTRRKLNKLYGDKVVLEDRPDPGAPPRQHVGADAGAGSTRSSSRSRASRRSTSRRRSRRRYDEQEDGEDRARRSTPRSACPPLPATFWERSMFQKPPGKEAVCHASAWDVTFSERPPHQDVHQAEPGGARRRSTTSSATTTTSHAYYKLPILFQNGANDGFHEAIGDTIVLSMTPEYLKEKGLLDKVVKNDKVDDQPPDEDRAREDRVPAVRPPRRQVAVGRVLRQGQARPVQPALVGAPQAVPGRRAAGARAPRPTSIRARSTTSPANVPYMRYFLAAVLQFQFHRALCKKAGHTGPLHECSIYDNKEAGAAFWKMLQTRREPSRGRTRCSR